MRRAGVVTIAAVLLLRAGPLPAQGIASPGPLSTAHASIDNISRCLQCHEAGRGVSGRRCLDCHAALGARLRADKGYHAVATRHGAALACGSCHSEHNGRPYRLVRWPDGSRDAFDHRTAGFRLEGAHARLACERCHRAALVTDPVVRRDSSLRTDRTYLGLGTTCASCHLDEHRGRVSRTCTDCHTQTDWKPAPGFDHARTRFPLTGRHTAVECSGCHPVRRAVASGPGGARDTSFVDFRTARTRASGCAGCHTSPHRATAQFRRCEDCHTETGWFNFRSGMRTFDHEPTGFPLTGSHATTPCETCHLTSARAVPVTRVPLVRANFLRGLGRQRMDYARCTDCHLSPHEGQLTATAARDCDGCHDDTHFTPARFDMAAHDATEFPITGAHRAVACSSCHAALPGAPAGSGRIQFRVVDRTCAGCHRDPHRAQFAGQRCDACHTTTAWPIERFDHERTRYPLRGAHQALACTRCHQPRGDSAAAAVFRGLPTTCAATGCHGDPHGGQFTARSRGGECTVCHSETAWRPPRFDHQTDTDWPLDGAHRTVDCAGCHPTQGSPPRVRYRPLPHRCEDCHVPGGNRP